MRLIKSNKSLATGNKGQIALFVALIFQVLFLFFAMIVNVGLVVHHKINLQNSVDMAAYYGAMKQAELLNSIAHMNYQMRQSWKLLAWRYRVLGTMGDDTLSPYDKNAHVIRPGYDVETSNNTAGNYERPPFCLAFPPFNDFNDQAVPQGENGCKTALAPNLSAQAIRLFSAPAVSAGFIAFAVQTASLTQTLRNSATNRCFNIGPFNYMTVANFLYAYQLDQHARRLVISRISKSMSRNKNDFDDIDGKSVKSGAEETFKRNLTYANKEGQGFNFEMYNSLSNPGCGNVPPDNQMEMPAPWLAEIRVFPTILYMDLECDPSDNRLTRLLKTLEIVDPTNLRNANNNNSLPWSYMNSKVPVLDPQIEFLARNLYLYSDVNRFVVGFEKNPWCQAYVGARATTKPKIPFAPSDLTLTAEAYAKPFGGRIGPWYNIRWAPTDPESNGDLNSRTDPNLSIRVKDVATLQGDPALFTSPLRLANYSKYIGDQFGLRSWRTMGHFARLIFNISPLPNHRTISTRLTPTDNKILTNDPKSLLFDDWYDIAKPPQANTAKDILAWRKIGSNESEPPIRHLEVAAIAPDQFDLAYYSIDPNYYSNYYTRLRDGLVRKLTIDDAFFRPDLGAHIGNQNLEKFSVKDQIKTVKDISPDLLDFRTKLTYNVLNPVHLLTSWSNKSLFEYDKIDNEYFGNCVAPTISKTNYVDPQTNSALFNPGESVPGECITGGRTGYSVKIVSKDFLFAPQKAGGENGATSTISNPPNDF